MTRRTGVSARPSCKKREKRSPTRKLEEDEDKRKWLGGRDSNPDNVVQRAANGLRFVPVRAVSFQCSALSVRFVTLRFGLFTHKMSQTVSRLDQSDASGDSYGILGN